LAMHALGHFAERYGQQLSGFSPEALQLMAQHDWPGNVRQLFNVVEQCVALADGPLVVHRLVAESLSSEATELRTLAEARDQFERNYLIQALRLSDGQVPRAAELAGRNRTDFYRLLRKHAIEAEDFKQAAAPAQASLLVAEPRR